VVSPPGAARVAFLVSRTS